MRRITAEIEMKIRKLASSMPVDYFGSKSMDTISGSELLLSGHKQVEGEDINPDKQYLLPVPVYLMKNHERRLRRAYKGEGREGIIRVIMPYIRDEAKEAVRNEINRIFK